MILPPEVVAYLESMFQRLERRMQQIANAEIVRVFGQSWEGGKLNGPDISGQIPLTALPPHASTHEAGGSDAIPRDTLAPQVTDRFEQLGADPGAPSDGEVWYNTAAHLPKVAVNGSTTVFETQSNKGVANGYAPLSSGVLVPTSYLGTGTANNTTFLRGDGTWAAPPTSGGTVTSVGLSMPSEFTVSGSPVTGSGTITVAKANESTNAVYAGPASGPAAAPAFRALVPADYPVFVASGASHAPGAVPDPGSVAGSTRYLREDATWQSITGANASQIQGRNVASTAPTDGQAIVWSNANNQWQPGTAGGGGGGTPAENAGALANAYATFI